ncbi:MAG: flavodoxin [Methanomicrobiales archaeon HGW-Methanomicrobiales-3]|jgi:flavodoxin|nr:MAG: flavodoxin [Methanomicrobiales archaeon HGW-Methanomicrobiales-3]
MNQPEHNPEDPRNVRSLVIVFSYHHNNTEKIARTIAGVLGAEVKTPQEIQPEQLREYDLIGFGSGIYSATFDPSVLTLADRLSFAHGRKAFLFSTYGAPAFAVTRDFVADNHEEMRGKLRIKGYEVIGDFGCAGWNTNSFLRFFGGINRGRPDSGDLANAETFARAMLAKVRSTENP